MNSLMHSSRLFSWLYPSLVWQKDTDKREVFLTFDDGPDPEITSYVLDVLYDYNFKATFFCIGENVQKHPKTFQRIIEEGHKVGNHTQNHLNGFITKNTTYVQNTDAAAELIPSNLFRPPYGRITRRQISVLSKEYNIIMWSILTGDYMSSLNPRRALKHMYKLTNPGSIIVFHDSQKAAPNLKIMLPQYCQFLKDNSYTSCSL